jgi:hypothetical protein
MDGSIIVALLLFGLALLLLRAIGAWMFRIDEVIDLLRQIRDQQKKE